MKTRTWIAIASLASLCGIAMGLRTPAAPATSDPTLDQAMAAIRADALRADMRFLSDNLLEGRRTGPPPTDMS